MKHKKSHKNEKHKKKKEKKKKKKSYSSSSDSSSDEEMWVEKETSASNEGSKPTLETKKSVERDEWMSNADIFSGVTKNDLRKKSNEAEKKEQNAILDCPGKSSRELNPYWKDGGTGLPSEDPGASKYTGDVNWLKKALQRAKEQAEEQGRSLEDIVGERWGSLEKLQSMIREAESRRQEHSFGKEYKNRESSRSFERDEKSKYRQRSGYEVSSSERENRRGRERDYDRYNSYRDGKKHNFKRPTDDCDLTEQSRHQNRSVRDSGESSKEKYESSSRRGWRKQQQEPNTTEESKKPARSDKEIEKTTIKEEESKPEEETIDLNYLNDIAAQVFRAEVMGNLELVAELKGKLEKARAASESKKSEVILTRTDKKGFTYPVKPGANESSRGKHKTKVGTHEGGKRMRYFGDDDKFTLQDMFEQEKMKATSDHDEVFRRLAMKKIGPDESARDMDDVFEETARFDEGDLRQNQERSRAIKEHKTKEKVMDNCRWCLENKMSRNSLITMGKQVYLSVPTSQSLTEGHCLIAPLQHIPCATALDEDIWEEVLNLKKVLVNLFLSQEEDVIFFESALYLNKYPHMVLNCVPVPKEMGDVAPIYFKKAILECEMEWSTNKKLVDLAGKGVRRAVPKGLSYFAVDFGMQDGFAHVIEDHKLFPNNFAQEIIGGMLDLDHSIWRKRRKESEEVLQKKVSEFSKLFQEYDPYKNK